MGSLPIFYTMTVIRLTTYFHPSLCSEIDRFSTIEAQIETGMVAVGISQDELSRKLYTTV